MLSAASLYRIALPGKEPMIANRTNFQEFDGCTFGLGYNARRWTLCMGGIYD